METPKVPRRAASFAWFVAVSLLAAACGGGRAPAAPAVCDEACQDNIALRSVRETMRFLYNKLLQGRPMGAQDETAPCPLKVGTIHIFGTAFSDDDLGTTTVNLTYEFQGCATRSVNATPERNYGLVLNGSVTEDGLLVMSTGTTALHLDSAAMSFAGTVYDPPVDPPLSETCDIVARQDGNNVSGTLCGRPAGFTGF